MASWLHGVLAAPAREVGAAWGPGCVVDLLRHWAIWPPSQPSPLSVWLLHPLAEPSTHNNPAA